MTNKAMFIAVILFSLIAIIILGHFNSHLTLATQQLTTQPKQVFCSLFICWLIFTLLRRPHDGDDWAGQL
jgi:uncharacterized membrane protein